MTDLSMSGADAKKDSSAVESTSPGYDRMAETHWNLISALEGGTPGMREASTKDAAFYLPQLEKEDDADWYKRLNVSYLHPGFTKGVSRVAAKPFGKKLVVQGLDTLDARLQAMVENVDGFGKTLHALARELMEDGWSRGLFHVGVDLPKKAEIDSRKGELSIRPRIFRIKPQDLFAWPYRITEEGEVILEQIRFMETSTDVEGFAVEETSRIRVWNSDSTWSLWELRRGKWEEIVAPTPWNYTGGIPLVTGYFSQTGFMEAESPFADVAWMNLAHWQSSSRQRWMLDFARTPFLFGSGFQKKEGNATFVVAANKLNTASNPQADIRVIEHKGTAIGAGQADLDDLERRMDEATLKPMQQKSGTPTAAARWLDEASVQCDAQACVMEVESVLTRAIQMAGAWILEAVSDEVQVKLPGDMLLRRSSDDIPHIQTARDNRDIDRQTYLEEFNDRGMFRDGRTVEDIEERLAEEQPDDDDALAGAGADALAARRAAEDSTEIVDQERRQAATNGR